MGCVRKGVPIRGLSNGAPQGAQRLGAGQFSMHNPTLLHLQGFFVMLHSPQRTMLCVMEPMASVALRGRLCCAMAVSLSVCARAAFVSSRPINCDLHTAHETLSAQHRPQPPAAPLYS